nr:PREDICTED: uncharacterized protein LOC109038929 isoform X2 [Bemisia tabaci]
MGDGKSNDIFPTLNSFCFCISLRTGSLCIAWYYLIAGLMGIIPMLPKQYDFITSISTTGNTGEMITRLLIVEYYFLLLLMVISCIFLIDGIRKGLWQSRYFRGTPHFKTFCSQPSFDF